MAPTPAGRILLDRASAILRLVADTRAAVSAERDAVKGTVRLGVPPTVGEVRAGRLVERFVTRSPAVTVAIVPSVSGPLHDPLPRGQGVIDGISAQQTARPNRTSAG